MQGEKISEAVEVETQKEADGVDELLKEKDVDGVVDYESKETTGESVEEPR